MTDQPTPPAAELTATLVIGRSYSRCGHCDENTLPQDTHHVDVSGWTPEPGKGCGARFVAMRSDYRGADDELKAVRPDLPIEGTPAAPSDAEQRAQVWEDAQAIEHARAVGMVEPEKAPAFLAAVRTHIATLGTRPVPQLADVRAAALREAADALDESETLRDLTDDHMHDVNAAANELRRMATAPVEERTERSYWQAIADALNAVESTGRSVGIDLDGTLTDHDTWSVVWDRDAVRWAVADYDDEGEQPSTPAEPKPAPAAPGDLFTEAAIYASALNAGITAIQAKAERDPWATIGDAVEVLRRLAHHHTTAEQPTGITWETRAAHAVRLYATTAIELEDARATIAALDAERTELIRQRDRITHDTMAALAAPLTADERQFLTFALDEAADEMANRDGFTDEDRAALDKFRRLAGPAPVPFAEEQPEPTALPYLFTDRDGDTLEVQAVAPGALGTPSLLITANDTDEDDQGSVFVPVAEVPALLAAITRAAAVATRDHEPKQAGR